MHSHRNQSMPATRRRRPATGRLLALAAALFCLGSCSDPAKQQEVIDLEASILTLQEKLEKTKELNAQALERRNAALAKKTASEQALEDQKSEPDRLELKVEELSSQLEAVLAEYKDYRIAYKKWVRKAVVGKEIQPSALGIGTKTSVARISSLDPERIGIITSDGVVSHALANLSEEIRWKLGYDPDGESLPLEPPPVDEVELEIGEAAEQRIAEKERFMDMLRERRDLLDRAAQLAKEGIPVPADLTTEIDRLENELTQSNARSAELIRAMNKGTKDLNRRRK